MGVDQSRHQRAIGQVDVLYCHHQPCVLARQYRRNPPIAQRHAVRLQNLSFRHHGDQKVGVQY